MLVSRAIRSENPGVTLVNEPKCPLVCLIILLEIVGLSHVTVLHVLELRITFNPLRLFQA